jgi:hypothetical protein
MKRSKVELEAWTSGDLLLVTTPDGVFEIEHGYPFRPPKYLVGGKDHIPLLYQRQSLLRDFMKRFKLEENCVCCRHLKCNWSPCYGLLDIMEEYRSYTRRLNTLSRLKVVVDNLPFDDNVLSVIVSFSQ